MELMTLQAPGMDKHSRNLHNLTEQRADSSHQMLPAAGSNHSTSSNAMATECKHSDASRRGQPAVAAAAQPTTAAGTANQRGLAHLDEDETRDDGVAVQDVVGGHLVPAPSGFNLQRQSQDPLTTKLQLPRQPVLLKSVVSPEQ